MNLFLKKIFVLVFIIFVSIEGFYQFNPYKKQEIETSYYASIIEKHTRLKSLPSPKIVLIAGSNFAYGINSEMIEKAFNRPVINMAIHYDFGTDFMLRQVENELKRGDLVVLGFEYIISKDGKLREKIQVSDYYPEAKKWYEYKDIFDFLRENFLLRISALRIYLPKIFSHTQPNHTIEDTTSMFFRRAINPYGDLVSHLNNPTLPTIPRGIINDKKDLFEVVENINEFSTKMRQKGVEVVYSFPAYAESSYKFDKKIIEKLENQIRQNAKFKIIGTPKDFVFADSLCQDMVYHLNKSGRDIRTTKLIELLKSTPFSK